jgi:Fe2+ or Zn2+ uptake regulation protein
MQRAAEEGGAAGDQAARRGGFQPDAAELVVRGLCADCAAR